MDKNRSDAIKKGLKRRKKRGFPLGNPQLDQVRCTDLTKANKARREKADAFAREMRETLFDIYASAGHPSISEIVNELNKRGIRTRRGTLWTSTKLKSLFERIAKVHNYRPYDKRG